MIHVFIDSQPLTQQTKSRTTKYEEPLVLATKKQRFVLVQISRVISAPCPMSTMTSPNKLGLRDHVWCFAIQRKGWVTSKVS